MLESVINISEGADLDNVDTIAAGGAPCLLDVHSDRWHNRSVITIGGPPDLVVSAAKRVARLAVQHLDIRSHSGAHPRLGVVDVVPFVDLDGDEAACAAQRSFANWAGDELELPCFLYGDERSLPAVRRLAFKEIRPDIGPWSPHPTAGACCVGVRPLLIAYNLWLGASATIEDAGLIARNLRSPAVRSLAFDLGGKPQVSCNLIAPLEVGPADVYDSVAAEAPVDHAELVGLVPASVLDRTPQERWDELALSPESTIERRLAAAGYTAAAS